MKISVRALALAIAAALLVTVTTAPAQAAPVSSEFRPIGKPEGMGTSTLSKSTQITRATITYDSSTGRYNGLIRIRDVDPSAYFALHARVYTYKGPGRSSRAVDVKVYRTPTGTLRASYQLGIQGPWKTATPGFTVTGNAIGFDFTEPTERGGSTMTGWIELGVERAGHGSFKHTALKQS